MRVRKLLAIGLVMFALPALASAQRELSTPDKPVTPESLVAIANVQLDAALDEKTAPGSKEGLLDNARKGYQKALQRDPKSKVALRGMAEFYARTGDREKAVEMYKKCLTLYPEAEIAHDVAVAHARWKDWAGAVSWCEYALKIDPENRTAKKTLGFSQAFAGKWDAAFATLCQIMPEAQARHNLAGLLDQMGQTDQSKDQLRLALKADPTYEPARKLLLHEIETAAAPPVPRELPAPTPVPAPRSTRPVPTANESPEFSVCFEVRALKVPVGLCEKIGVKLTGDEVLTDAQLYRVLEAAQTQRDVTVMQYPKVTADDGQTATVRVTDQQFFVTAIEATKVKGQTVFVPKNTPVEVGDVLTLTGHVLLDRKRVSLRANVTHTTVGGKVDLVPVTTQITPIFEGGSQGQPVPFTQFLQVPDVKTEKIEKSAIVPTDGTVILGRWKEKEPEEPKGDRPARGKVPPKKEKSAEFEVVILATVHILPPEPVAVPRPVPGQVTKVFTVTDLVAPDKPVGPAGEKLVQQNADRLMKLVTDMVRPYSWQTHGGKGTIEFYGIGCAVVVSNTADAVREVSDLLEALRRLQERDAVAPMPREVGTTRYATTYKLRNVAAADAADALRAFLKGRDQSAVVVAEPVSNTVLVSAGLAVHKQLLDILAGLDKAPQQIMMQAMVVEVPHEFLERAGLNVGSEPGAMSWTLTARELHMLTQLFREAKGRGEIDVLSRPQMQVCDGQTGFVQVGQQFPVVGQPVRPAGGANASELKMVHVGLQLKVTPKVSPDGASVCLDTETTLSKATGNANTPFSERSVRVAAQFPRGQTLVFACGPQGQGGQKRETLVILTPTVLAPACETRPAGGVK
jgi:type II secretory pathway component GspD/PulD (secretin)